MPVRAFAIRHKSDAAMSAEWVAKTVAGTSGKAIRMFQALEGNGRYIRHGWMSAMRDGYELVEVQVAFVAVPENKTL